MASVVAWCQTSSSICEQAARDFQQGRTEAAENALKSLLRAHPSDLSALSLMAVVLDTERRYAESEAVYTQALRIAPRSTALLNNLGNHYVATGDLRKAQGSFEAVVAIDPHHVNANLQLAQIGVRLGHGTEALRCMSRLEAADQAEPVAQLLKAQALALVGKCDSSVRVLDALGARTVDDSRFDFSIGMAYATCRHYDQAENLFGAALKSDPSNFDVLYNLGLAAGRAGHSDRAQQVFEAALRVKPDDPDVLYALGDLLIANKDYLAASALLYRAAHAAPDRADLLLLLTRATGELGYYEETALVYEKYLKLRPADETARREHGFWLICAGRLKEGIPEVQRYASKHPKDAHGQYELAMGEASGSPEKALAHLDEALTLDPKLFQARYARAVLNYQQDKLDRSWEDLDALQKLDSHNPRVLDLQAQIYLRRDQAQDAEALLKQALELAPRDHLILWHYSKALQKLGRTEELNAALVQFRQAAVRGDEHNLRKGLFDFLDLTPKQQDAKFLKSLQDVAEANPDNILLKVRLAKTLLDQGNTERAEATFRDVLSAGVDSATVAECGRFLMQHEQYGLAAEFLQKVPNAGLDLAIALFHSLGAEAALTKLDGIPVDQRNGDYFLLRAQVLDAMGKTADAADSLNRGIRAAPTRADMYFQGATFLIKHHEREKAATLLADATRIAPDAAELWMARAIVLGVLRRSDEALRVLAQIESRWPEWDLTYLVNGVILDSQLKAAEAKQMFDTAIALGTQEADAYYYRAQIATETTPVNLEEAQTSISQALALNPKDANIRLLAGKILLGRKEYNAAVEQLLSAVRLQPTLVRAHNLLRTAYRELGQSDKAAEELKQVQQITEEISDPDPVSSSMERLLFDVRPPDGAPSSE